MMKILVARDLLVFCTMLDLVFSGVGVKAAKAS
jgi:hypothetical protein